MPHIHRNRPYPPSTLFSVTTTLSKPTLPPRKIKPDPFPLHPFPLFGLHPTNSHTPKTPPANTQPIPTAPEASTAPRKPHKGRELTESSLRPRVRAAERLSTWETPFSLEKKSAELAKFPREVIDSGNTVMLAGLAPSTMTTYAAGLLRWSQYCDSMNISEEDRMPASDILIIGFMGFHMGKVSGSTVKNWLAGLRAWHELKGATWPAESRRIRFARRGANVEGAAHKRHPRHPITVAHLWALRKALDFKVPFHCALWACALTAFWSCRRLGI